MTWFLVCRLLLEKISDGTLFYDRSYWQLLLSYSVKVTNHCRNSPNAVRSLVYWGAQNQVGFSESCALPWQKLCAQRTTSWQKSFGLYLETPWIRRLDWSPLALELTNLETLQLPASNWSPSYAFPPGYPEKGCYIMELDMFRCQMTQTAGAVRLLFPKKPLFSLYSCPWQASHGEGRRPMITNDSLMGWRRMLVLLFLWHPCSGVVGMLVWEGQREAMPLCTLQQHSWDLISWAGSCFLDCLSC